MALIVEVLEAESAVGPHRLRLDAHARLRVPAHVTVLYPFAPWQRIDEHMRSRLTAIFARAPAFEHSLVRCDWFGEEVLCADADADAGFRTLTSSVCAAFPAYPPYGGRFDDAIPHLIVGRAQSARGHARGRKSSAAVAAAARGRAVARSVTLMAEDVSGRWHRDASFALGRR